MVDQEEQPLSPVPPPPATEGPPASAPIPDARLSQTENRSASEETPGTPVPGTVVLNDYQAQTVKELYDLGTSLGLRVGGVRSKHQLVFEILSHYGRQGSIIEATGILEVTRDGMGILRNPRYSFAPFPDDIFLAPSTVRRFNLRPGLSLKVTARAPRDAREKFICAENVLEIEGQQALEGAEPPVFFDKLTAKNVSVVSAFEFRARYSLIRHGPPCRWYWPMSLFPQE